MHGSTYPRLLVLVSLAQRSLTGIHDPSLTVIIVPAGNGHIVVDPTLIQQVRFRGGSTIYLGADDENDRTSLGGVDLYLDPLGVAARIQKLGRHPFEFYRKVGFVIVGVLPDANGFGKPDIFMAKRVQNGA